MSATGSAPNEKSPNGNRKQRRLRRPGLLPTPGPAQVPYANSHPDLKGMTPAQVTRMILDSQAWKDVMKPVLEELDRTRRVTVAQRFRLPSRDTTQRSDGTCRRRRASRRRR